MSARLNRQIAAELDALRALNLLTPEQAEKIAARYPTTPWDLAVLIRIFTGIGGLTAGAGAVLIAKEFVNALRLGEAGLALATVGLIGLARWLRRAKGLVATAAALEMGAGFALQGLTFVLAADFSTGSKDWPALVGMQTALLALLAYGLRNRLVLAHALVCFYVYLGGRAGYESGWGAYWVALDSPVLFLIAGCALLAAAWVHGTRLTGALQAFSRVYGHLGWLGIHFGFWFLAVFGYFLGHPQWGGPEWPRAVFSALWAAVSVLSLWLAGRLGQRMLRGYGLTFLLIDAYTFYFRFVVAHSLELWFLHMLLTGGSLVALGIWLERMRRPRSTAPPPAV